MNKQKLATAGCIVLSIVFSLSLSLLVYFKAFLPFVNSVYEKVLYYSEDLYEEYQKEAERMIARNEFASQYHAQTTFYSANGRTTLVIQIGDYNLGYSYSCYITATVENFGTNEQEVTFERHRNSAEQAYEEAESYRNGMRNGYAVFIFLLVIFTVYLIINSIKRRYSKVFIHMILMIFVIILLTLFFC